MKLNEITSINNSQYILYRGDISALTSFRRSPDGALGPGIYLTQDESAAKSYGPYVTKVIATIKNPIIVKDATDEAIAIAIATDEEFWKASFFTRGAARKWAIEQWNDYAGIGDPDFIDMMRQSRHDGVILYHGNNIIEATVLGMNQIQIVEE